MNGILVENNIVDSLGSLKQNVNSESTSDSSSPSNNREDMKNNTTQSHSRQLISEFNIFISHTERLANPKSQLRGKADVVVSSFSALYHPFYPLSLYFLILSTLISITQYNCRLI